MKHQKKKVEWNVACANTSRRSCDFSEAHLYYWGIYLLRVRAHANGTLSQSVHLKFQPDKHGERRRPWRQGLKVMKGTRFRDPVWWVLGLIEAVSAPPAEVGPPSRVALSHAGKDVDVYIDDPVAGDNTSMKKFLPNLSYHIRYWEGPSLAQVEAPLSTLPSFSSSSGDTCC